MIFIRYIITHYQYHQFCHFVYFPGLQTLDKKRFSHFFDICFRFWVIDQIRRKNHSTCVYPDKISHKIILIQFIRKIKNAFLEQTVLFTLIKINTWGCSIYRVLMYRRHSFSSKNEFEIIADECKKNVGFFRTLIWAHCRESVLYWRSHRMQNNWIPQPLHLMQISSQLVCDFIKKTH